MGVGGKGVMGMGLKECKSCIAAFRLFFTRF